MKSGWDADAYAEQMKRSTSPVSAFFLIDSLEAIATCTHWLAHLTAYNMPSMQDSPYFKKVRAIYESQQAVMNVDDSFTLLWENQVYPRCTPLSLGRQRPLRNRAMASRCDC